MKRLCSHLTFAKFPSLLPFPAYVTGIKAAGASRVSPTIALTAA